MQGALGAAILACLAASGAAAAGRIVVVCECRAESYAGALDGIREGLGGAAETIDLGQGGETQLGALAREPNLVVIAVGREARRAVAEAKLRGAVVSAMLLRQDAARIPLAGSAVRDIELDVPLGQWITEWKRVFPRQSRLGVLVNAATPGEAEAVAAEARAAGAVVVVSAARGPAELLRAFVALKGRVDFVLALPDSSLYNSATVKPLILASLDHRLPIAGFSANFVRAGAAAGIYPDFREAGRQAAEAALRAARNHSEAGGSESPRKLTVAVNPRVLRLLGIDYTAAPGLVVCR
jgi:hypothetical protein